MNGPRNLREIDRLSLSQLNYCLSQLTISVSKQIIFACFGHLREELHSHRIDVRARPLTLHAGSTLHLSGRRLRVAGLKHYAPEICNQHYAPYMFSFFFFAV